MAKNKTCVLCIAYIKAKLKNQNIRKQIKNNLKKVRL